uniref:U44-Eretoxin-Ek1a_1 n=1 Tax=Eresus cinnaberinus TaxID=175337 RepID=A0A2D0PCK2_ERECI
MHLYWVLLLISAFAVAACQDNASGLDPRDMEAIQSKLEKYDILEAFLRRLFGIDTEKSRDDQCIPVGGECHFWSGPNCCGLRTRCVVWDTQLPATKYKSSATWISKCREYRLGVWLDDIGNWFSSLG